MKHTPILLMIWGLVLFPGHTANANRIDNTVESAPGWKAGIARTVITPDQPMWMSGYSSRNRPSEGTLHDLWAKALALEDADGRQAVLVTADLRNFPKNLSDRIRDRVAERFGLTRAQILLNGSHTHSGPLLNTIRNYDYYISALNAEQQERVRQYSEALVGRIVNLVGSALRSLEPAALYAGNGVARFAVNRRNNEEGELEGLTELAGPSDHSVPVLKVVDRSGELMAVAFGYACHPTTLNFYRWSGDWPGFAQLQLERDHPGATALFFQGAGGDQNPLPRRSVPLAEQYGREMAAAVERVLDEEGLMRPLSGQLRTGYSEVELQLSTPPSEETLRELAEGAPDSRRGRWASRQLDKLERGEPLRRTYPYPVQIWRLGEQTLIGLGGELVVDYAIELKRIFGQQIFVLGYSNDVMSYIPTVRIIREGGYEGASSQMVRGMPSTWETNIETVILNEVLRVAEKVGVPIHETTLIPD
ncbi:MAG: neutral/alkaline non-lysosomal ceramidase N-terminal domain-containing protein [Balneolaceae bacterium]|nr:neutral/alkaline non-lysosomal ceramidase N-terminal domain-containing protein [Balneolaceae bacterium]